MIRNGGVRPRHARGRHFAECSDPEPYIRTHEFVCNSCLRDRGSRMGAVLLLCSQSVRILKDNH
jgi:hypothetical protein